MPKESSEYFQDLISRFPDLGLVPGVELSSHTTFRVGGPAALFASAQSPGHLQSLCGLACSRNLPVFILGGGSNVLFSDEGYRGLVVKLEGEFSSLELLTRKGEVAGGGAEVTAGAGVRLQKLVSFAKRHCLSGLEDLTGIPGRVGGAVFMNAGAFEGSIGERVERIRAFDPKSMAFEDFAREELVFSYRSLKAPVDGVVILEAVFSLRKAESLELLKEKMASRLSRRMASLPKEPSAGSFFKNPQGLFAGKLIDMCGFKGKRVGGAMVSNVHANVIVNFQKATSADIRNLAAEIEEGVFRRFGIRLEREVRMVDWEGKILKD